MFRLIKVISLLLALALFGGWNCGASNAAETLTKEKSKAEIEEQEKKGNIFNMIFGSAPSMPTERGLLLIYAYHDENGNQVKDAGEEDLRNEIVCRVDGIQYRIPAFIPALALHENYKVECHPEASSNSFAPENDTTELFVQRQGQVFFIELPCQRLKVAQKTPE